jgi:1-acyl-sn-glycerol-3-phosphate acyltransferase
MSDVPLARLWSYHAVRVAAWLVGVSIFQIRCKGRENYPRTGGALVCANHQSHIDAVLVGLSCNRLLYYLARSTLFKFTPFARLIEWFNAIPIDRAGIGLGGLKATLRNLKKGNMVLIFPEGTRSPDGAMRPLKPGFCAVARRGKVPLVPVGLDGTYDAWPRNTSLPRPAVIHMAVGEPISPELVASFDDDQLVAELERRIRACHEQCRAGRRRARENG